MTKKENLYKLLYFKKQNLYKLLNVSEYATSKEIKLAFIKDINNKSGNIIYQSLTLHIKY